MDSGVRTDIEHHANDSSERSKALMNRADRRRREKEDERAVAQGLTISARDARQTASMMRLIYREVLQAKRDGNLQPLFSFFLNNLAKTTRQAPNDMIACRKGCCHCCHMWVSATAPEILFVAAQLRREGSDLVQILERARQTRGLNFDARGKHVAPCPLLSNDGLCSVYSARPLACRTAASIDAEICRRGYLELSDNEIPTPMFFLLQRVAYAIALRGAFKRAGLPLISYELNEALEIALTAPDAERRWLEGEDLFADVQRDPNGDPLDQAGNRQLYEYAFAEFDTDFS
jgi:Fe-S-cluster containining protein